MAAFTMTSTQMRPAIVTWTAQGNAVDAATVTPVYASTDEAVARLEMRKADGSMPDATDPGVLAAVAYSNGTATLSLTVTNADASVFALTGDFTVADVVPPAATIDGGALDFGPAVEKAPAPAQMNRRR